ncbi:ceramidase domain-containing protein [Parasphingorhabdus sp.]|uniref:ceramidase domain-containing protein n=1 Tax=Parasphingorhabdus sp. TaxID=2709688 RepID=UPI003262F599
MTQYARKIVTAAALTALMATITVALLSLAGPSWTRFLPASCMETRCFCEIPRPGTILLQPANSLSSFGFVFAGFLMILLARSRDWWSAFPPLSAKILGVSAIIVGIGSLMLHATLTLWGQFFDVLGMYLISGFFLISALSKWRNIPDRRAMIYYALLCAVLVAILYMMPEVRRWLFAVVLMAAILLELVFARPLRPQVQTGYYIAGLIANTVAFTIWNLDQNGQLCAPESLLQGHAIWHVLGAVALWFAFLYYRSEQPVTDGSSR